MDLHNKNCLIEKIALFKIIFLRCLSELIFRDRMEVIPSRIFFLEATTGEVYFPRQTNAFLNVFAYQGSSL